MGMKVVDNITAFFAGAARPGGLSFRLGGMISIAKQRLDFVCLVFDHACY